MSWLTEIRIILRKCTKVKTRSKFSAQNCDVMQDFCVQIGIGVSELLLEV
jgi:hypothetical protein